MNIFNYITNFSPELIDIIISYLGKHEFEVIESKKHILNKFLYNTNPGIERICYQYKDNYIRWIIRNDCVFLFNYALNFIINNKKKYIKYKNVRYNSYIEYVKYLISIYNSGKCKQIIWNVKST